MTSDPRPTPQTSELLDRLRDRLLHALDELTSQPEELTAADEGSAARLVEQLEVTPETARRAVHVMRVGQQVAGIGLSLTLVRIGDGFRAAMVAMGEATRR